MDWTRKTNHCVGFGGFVSPHWFLNLEWAKQNEKKGIDSAFARQIETRNNECKISAQQQMEVSAFEKNANTSIQSSVNIENTGV